MSSQHFIRGGKRRFNYSLDSPRIKTQQAQIEEPTWWEPESLPLVSKEEKEPSLVQKEKKHDHFEKEEEDEFIRFKFKIKRSTVETAAVAVVAGLAVILFANLLIKDTPMGSMASVGTTGGIIIDGVHYLPINGSVFSGLGPL